MYETHCGACGPHMNGHAMANKIARKFLGMKTVLRS